MTLRHCSACKLVFYCSAAHQKEHWDSAHRRVCRKRKAGKAKAKSGKKGGGGAAEDSDTATMDATMAELD